APRRRALERRLPQPRPARPTARRAPGPLRVRAHGPRPGRDRARPGRLPREAARRPARRQQADPPLGRLHDQVTESAPYTSPRLRPFLDEGARPLTTIEAPASHLR